MGIEKEEKEEIKSRVEVDATVNENENENENDSSSSPSLQESENSDNSTASKTRDIPASQNVADDIIKIKDYIEEVSVEVNSSIFPNNFTKVPSEKTEEDINENQRNSILLLVPQHPIRTMKILPLLPQIEMNRHHHHHLRPP